MKKLLLAAASLVLALTACQKDETSAPGTATSSSFSVTIPQNFVRSRAVSDVFGTGTLINRCILEIYHGNELYQRIEKGVAGGSVTFDNLRLIPSQTYDFVFWADCAEGSEGNFTDKTYSTSSLTSITENGEFAGNSDERDAFFHCLKGYKVTGQFSESVTLTRPFGLLVVKTNDLAEIQDESLKPNGYSVAFKGLPTTFNALTGEVSGSADITYTATELAKNDGTISMDFLWAAEAEAVLADFSMTFLNNGNEITTNSDFRNIPIRRNYKTNVSGNLLTKKGTITVTIDTTFTNPPYDEEITEVTTVADVTSAIESGATNIVVKTEPEADATILIPQTFTETDAKISIALPETDKNITVQYSPTAVAEAPAVVNISIPNAQNLTIDLPESTVTLNGEAYDSVTATTAENTLIIPEGVTVGTLTVKKGNVELYGKVGEMTFEEGAGIVKTYAVGDAATLKAAVGLISAKKCERIVLTADIDLQGSADNKWQPIDTENSVFAEFDGAGHTLSNLYIDNYTGQTDSKGFYYGGLFYVLRGTVKNLTIDKATVTCFRGGALVGRMDHGLLENCRVKNVTVTSYQKAAGLVGFVSTNSMDVTVRGCSVENCAVKTTAPEEGLYQAGGLIGYLQTMDRNVLIENNSVSGISFDKVYESADNVADKVYDMEQLYSHAFIGTIANLSKTEDAYDKYTVELRGNRVAQQVSGIPTCDRTDKYIGWWAGDCNAGGYLYAPKLVVDGVAKDRWIEVKRLVSQIAAGGEVTVYRSYNLSAMNGAVEITKPTVLTLNDNVVINSDKEATQLVNRSELTVKAGKNATVNMFKRVIENYGTLTVEGGNYTTASRISGTAFWNNAEDAVMNLNGVTVDATMFAVAGSGKININGGTIKSTSSNKYDGKNWAYCIRAQQGGQMTIKDATVEGVQGCIAAIEGSHITVDNAKVSARNSEPGRQDAFYALYSASDAILEVLSGEFYSDRTPCCLASDDDNPANPYGGFMLKGGKYSSQPMNDGVSPMKPWTPETGYQYREITDGGDFKWEIVAM